LFDVFVTGMGVALPNEAVDNEQIENVLGLVGGRPSRSKPRVLKSNGIEYRYYAIDPVTGEQTHSNAQLTAEAVRQVAARASFPLQGMQCLVCGTSSPDQLIPNHALMVQGELSCGACEVVATMGVCCSGVTSLKYGVLNVASGATENAITTGSELVSNQFTASYFKRQSEDQKLPFEKDFLRWMLSDGAGAALLERQPRNGLPSLHVDWIEIMAYANELESCMYAGGLKRSDGSMQGWRDVVDPEELRQAGYLDLRQDAKLLSQNIVPYGIRRALTTVRERHDLSPDQVTWFVPHYSSQFFRQPLFDELEQAGFPIPFDKWFTNLTYKGNIGSASLYVMLEELLTSDRLRSGDRILCAVPESARFTFAYILFTVV
jgi:3-oxoacyl-[acyl-carrier-protein] synthase-3